MPRYRMTRRFRGRSQRRTNWIGRTATSIGAATGDVTPGNIGSIELLDPSDAADEVSKYTSPTIVRIRGYILLDWSISAGTVSGSELGHSGAVLHVGPTALTSFNDANLSSDRILWQDGGAVSRNTALVSGADNPDMLNTFGYVSPKLEIDVRAMRRLEDDNRLFLTFWNAANSNVDLEYTYAIRILVKE